MIIALTLFSVFESFGEATIIILRTKINGDGTGKYNNVTRRESSFTNLAGDVTITITIGCADPGPDGCPVAIPAHGSNGTYDMDPSVANYAEVRMAEIDGEINNGNHSANNTRIVCITMSDGSQKSYRVYENWNCDSNGNGDISLKLEEIVA